MPSLIETVPQLATYTPAFTALMILVLAVLVQALLAGVLGLGKSEEVPGMPLRGDHSKLSFRVLRTYGNSTENFSVMIATTLLAIAAGVSPTLVNWLVGLHVAIRLAYWAVYYGGIGKVGGGPRTIAYVAAFGMNVILALLAAYALVF